MSNGGSLQDLSQRDTSNLFGKHSIHSLNLKPLQGSRGFDLTWCSSWWTGFFPFFLFFFSSVALIYQWQWWIKSAAFWKKVGICQCMIILNIVVAGPRYEKHDDACTPADKTELSLGLKRGWCGEEAVSGFSPLLPCVIDSSSPSKTSLW